MSTRMFPRPVFFVALLVGLAASTCARPEPPATTAKDLVAAAVARAESEDRTVPIEFGASWCVWCRSFEAFVKASDTGPVVAKHFVILNLTVREEEEQKALNTPGAVELMKMWGGEKSGLPFYVFLDVKGRMIANSNAMPDGANIGFPAVPAEIAAFMTLINKTAPRLASAERGTLQAYLERVMPRPTPH